MLTFDLLTKTNAERCSIWHPGFPYNKNGWSGADWSNAMVGEAGEAANIVKKLRRLEIGLKTNAPDYELLRYRLGEEIADTCIYLDLLATFYQIDFPVAVVSKFNATSREYNFEQMLPVIKR